MEKAPGDEPGGCRFDPCRRHALHTTPRWSNGHDAGFSTRRPGFDSPSRYPCQIVQRVGRPVVARLMRVRILLWQPPLGGRGSRHAVAARVTRVRVPPGRPVVVVQRRGCEHAMLVMRVRVPPTTREAHAGEVRVVGRSRRIRDPVGSTPTTGPNLLDAKTEGSFTCSVNAREGTSPSVAWSPSRPMVLKL